MPLPPYQIEEPFFSTIDKKKLQKLLLAPDNYEGINNRSVKLRDYVFTEGGRLATEKHCDESKGKLPSKY